MHSRRVGTHIQRERRRGRIEPAPQKQRRDIVARASSFNEIIEAAVANNCPEDQLQIRRNSRDFTLVHRYPTDTKGRVVCHATGR